MGLKISPDEAKEIRSMKPKEVLSGMENINSVIVTRKYGKVIVRKRKRRPFSKTSADSNLFFRPFLEGDILAKLNEEGLSFSPELLYADPKGIILRYIEGETPDFQNWQADKALRDRYAEDIAHILGKLAQRGPELFPGRIRFFHENFSPEMTSKEYAEELRQRTEDKWNQIIFPEIFEYLEELGDITNPAPLKKDLEVSDARSICLLHGDLSPQNTVSTDEKLYVIDWTNASGGDPLWDLYMMKGHFPEGSERLNFIEKWKEQTPAVSKENMEADLAAYAKLANARTRTLAAEVIREGILQALNTFQTGHLFSDRESVLLPIARQLSHWPRYFSEHPQPRQWTAEENYVSLEKIVRRIVYRTPFHSFAATSYKYSAAFPRSGLATSPHRRRPTIL